MTYETQKDKELLDEMKSAGDFAVEKDLNEEDLEAVSGGCYCICGKTDSCGGGGGGQSM